MCSLDPPNLLRTRTLRHLLLYVYKLHGASLELYSISNPIPFLAPSFFGVSLPDPSPPVSVPHGSLPPSLLSRQSLENEKENIRHARALRFFPHAFFPLLVAPCLTNTLNMGHQLTKTINRG